MSKKLVKYRKKYQDEPVLSSHFDKMSSILLGYCLYTLCRFNTFISLLLNHLTHLYHILSIIIATDKIRSTLNKLFRVFEPLLVIALGWWYLKAKRVQDCKEPEVEMYKPIWGLVFKCNGSGIQFNSIQFITRI
jgi:hypothetical protein